MVDDGLFDRFPKPDVVLGQHVAPLPAGKIAGHPGLSYAGSDSLRVRVIGRGAHGSMPEASIDPIVIAAEVVLRLQTIISREIPSTATAVLTVGSIHAGDAANVIPGEVVLQLNIRSYDAKIRQKILDSVDRIVRGEAATAGAPEEPEITSIERFPVVTNDPSALGKTLERSPRGWGRTRSSIPERVQAVRTSESSPRVLVRPWHIGCSEARILRCSPRAT